MVALWVFGAGLAGTAVGAATGGPGRAATVAIPVLAVIVAIGVWIGVRARGQRNAAGRAVTDQLIGFRTYLATAEADQLKFEEGEDIFSKYLPWAIAFELADRWQRVCAQLVAAGRIYPAYETAQELDLRRKIAAGRGLPQRQGPRDQGSFIPG